MSRDERFLINTVIETATVPISLILNDPGQESERAFALQEPCNDRVLSAGVRESLSGD